MASGTHRLDACHGVLYEVNWREVSEPFLAKLDTVQAGSV